MHRAVGTAVVNRGIGPTAIDDSPVIVVQFQRHPAAGQVSIERLFREVRRNMPSDVACTVHISPWPSSGGLARAANVRDANLHQGQINHVTGDVHYLSLGLGGRRTLLTIHDCVSLERLSGLKRSLFRWLWYSLPVRKAALVSVVSESTRRQVLRHVACDAAKIRVVHNCVSSDFVRHDKPFNTRKPIVLQVGTGANKNLGRSIEALAGMACHFRIIGELSSVQRRALERHNIEFSYINRATDGEVVQAYRACDVLLFVSTYEGFGLPIIEANATGRAVITSNLFSMPEVAGEAACLVNPYDSASIRRGILRVIEDAAYRERLMTAGFENAKRFSPRVIAAQYAALYRELAEQQ